MANIENFDSTFENCELLENIGNSNNLSIISAQKANKMFNNCKNLKTVSFSNPGNVSGDSPLLFMSSKFNNCELLENLDLSNLNPENVLTLDYAFSDCKKIASLDTMAQFNIQSVINLDSIFNNCEKQVYIKEYVFYIRKVVKMK